MSDNAQYTFLPYVRRGLGARLVHADTGSATEIGTLELPLELTVENDTGSTSTLDVELTLRGPGDVSRVAESQIVRVEPIGGASGFEENYFPFIEFARADFPWLLTPASPDGDARLRPWLALVVVELNGDVDYSVRSDGLGELVVSGGYEEQLPDLSESWYWAHVQLTGILSASDSLASIVANEPERLVSRLICPRRLKPSSSYRACLVPAFETGRRAACGEDLDTLDPASLAPAWQPGLSSVTLPVFYSWTFSTGPDGDFESLVRKLQPGAVNPSFGTRRLDASDAGLGLPGVLTEALEYVGVLRAPGGEPSAWDGTEAVAFREMLQGLVNRAGEYSAEDGDDPVVAPPIYGRWHAALEKLDDRSPAWVRELNLNPCQRVLAAMGTKVVKREQESLMASAWEQVDEINAVNQALARAQAAREFGRSMKRRHIDHLRVEVRAQLSGPSHARLRVGDGATLTLKGSLAATSLPAGAASASLRRAMRPGGPIGRVARRRSEPTAHTSSVMLKKFDASELGDWDRPVAKLLGADLPLPHGTQTAGTIPAEGDGATGLTIKGALTLSASALSERLTASRTRIASGDLGSEPLAGDALETVRGEITRFNVDAHVGEAEAMNLSVVGDALTKEMDPAAAVTARMKLRINGPEELWSRSDELDRVMAAPAFPQPMYSYLQSVAGEWFAPGLDEVGDNVVTLVETNGAAIEAYMVGLSHEMSRELLWREYPTDQRGTYFRQFWDPTARYGDPTAGTKDIDPIHTWSSELELGDHAASDGHLVLLIRGELLRRYQDTIVYAQPAIDSRTPDETREIYPVFSATLGRDTVALGFDLEYDEVVAEPGYFFVFEQHPVGPRFGLDLGEPEAFGSWDDLSWEMVEADGHIDVGATSLGSISGIVWGRNAAHMARITLQKPVRVLIHAKKMLASD